MLVFWGVVYIQQWPPGCQASSCLSGVVFLLVDTRAISLLANPNPCHWSMPLGQGLMPGMASQGQLFPVFTRDQQVSNPSLQILRGRRKGGKFPVSLSDLTGLGFSSFLDGPSIEIFPLWNQTKPKYAYLLTPGRENKKLLQEQDADLKTPKERQFLSESLLVPLRQPRCL